MNKFLAEIQEQPQALLDTYSFYLSDKGHHILSSVRDRMVKGAYQQVIFTGMGSSFFISEAATILMSDLSIPIYCINNAELLHYRNDLLHKPTLLVCMSQSGESFETREILKLLSDKVFCIGITNNLDSTLGKQCHLTLPCFAGPEEMTSTKTYVSCMLVVYILGWFITDQWTVTKKEEIQAFIDSFEQELTLFPLKVPHILSFFGDLEHLHIIARGPCFSTACQSGLMFKEANAIAATGILGGEFRHGPMEMVGPGFKSILFAAKGPTLQQSLNMAEDIAKFGGKVLVITNSALDISLGDSVKFLVIDVQDEFLFSIASIIPIQLFIDAYAKQNGYEAGVFSHGSKVTSVE